MNQEQAIFAAGSFWDVESLFRELRGVTNAESGYIGGTTDLPTYEQVQEGGTGHAQAVRVTFDPRMISYELLLRKFFTMHDPTQLNQQGTNVGTQYRSAIFTLSDEQQDLAEQLKHEFQGKTEKTIATEVLPATIFWPAEDEHQDYWSKNMGTTCEI